MQRYAIVLLDGDVLIGNISLHNIDHLHRNAFIGIFIGEEQQRGQGLGAEAIRLINGRAETECSGNVTKENINTITQLGVDYISSGALTHSAPILDISMKHLRTV